ncbi:MAG: dihydroorotase [Bacteroidales bacterium]|nr:dihydroorotase [Bacteroidales bacterium]
MYIYFKGGTVINRPQNILIKNGVITEVSCEDIPVLPDNTRVIDCSGMIILPGIIDTHVHFREPGNEEKADMDSESKAALAGGVTTVFDMPNNNPAITTEESFFKKTELAKQKMNCNFKLFFGLTNNNIPQAVSMQSEYLAGLKLFLGSSTGNMLVDNQNAIDELFKKSDKIIVAHCEDENLIRNNKERFEHLSPLPYNIHAMIRDTQVCFNSSRYAVEKAKKYGTDFHIAHITTAKEIELLSDNKLANKKITAEVSPNHLYYCDEDYKTYKNLIKCNPSIKSAYDRKALRQALKEGFIDIVATDHAPHLLSEKQKDYFHSPSGIPSIQFSLLMMLQIAKEEQWNLSLIAEKMCHNPAKRFAVKQRGFIEKGYFADLVVINPNKKTFVKKENIVSKCKWSPLEGKTFDYAVEMTVLNGKIVYNNGKLLLDKE